MNQNVRQDFHKNGTLRLEVALVNAKPHGLLRRLHPNGVLAAEGIMEHGFAHGIWKSWNDKGEFLGQSEMNHGTGIAYEWFDNGKIKSEISCREGKYHGRMRLWDEAGELDEAYFINFRRVSKKKYREACVKDPTLPRYEDEALQGRSARPNRKVTVGVTASVVSEQVKQSHHQTIEKLLNSNKQEALAWLKGSTQKLFRSVGEMSGMDSVELIEEVYAAGAVQVLAVEISPPLEGEQSTDKLVIELPDRKRARKKIFICCNDLKEQAGYGLDEDWGQKHLWVWFD